MGLLVQSSSSNLKTKYNQTRVWDPGEDSTEQAAPNDLGTAEEDAWYQWRSQLINEGGEHRGAEAVLRNWEIRRSHHCGKGHGAAHAGALSGMGAVPLHPAARHR